MNPDSWAFVCTLHNKTEYFSFLLQSDFTQVRLQKCDYEIISDEPRLCPRGVAVCGQEIHSWDFRNIVHSQKN